MSFPTCNTCARFLPSADQRADGFDIPGYCLYRHAIAGPNDPGCMGHDGYVPLDPDAVCLTMEGFNRAGGPAVWNMPRLVIR